jgi:hypothetical protein
LAAYYSSAAKSSGPNRTATNDKEIKNGKGDIVTVYNQPLNRRPIIEGKAVIVRDRQCQSDRTLKVSRQGASGLG